MQLSAEGKAPEHIAARVGEPFLYVSAKEAKAALKGDAPKSLQLYRFLASSPADDYFKSVEYRTAVLSATLQVSVQEL